MSRSSKKSLALLVGQIVLLVVMVVWVNRPIGQSKPEVKSLITDSQNQTIRVIRVVDGDTIEVEGGIVIRLIGINSPESVDPRKKIECYAKAAYDFSKENLEGAYVKLEKDISESDKFKRLLRYVWLNDQLFNEVLVREGFAQVTTFPPDVKYKDRLLRAQEEAKSQFRGLWGSCPF